MVAECPVIIVIENPLGMAGCKHVLERVIAVFLIDFRNAAPQRSRQCIASGRLLLTEAGKVAVEMFVMPNLIISNVPGKLA